MHKEAGAFLALLSGCFNPAAAVCRSEGEKAILPVHFERACQLEQLDIMGLGPLENKYLAILKDGASQLNVIASVLGLPTRTVSEVTEQFLIRAGLIDKSKDGLRELTMQRPRTRFEEVKKWNKLNQS